MAKMKPSYLICLCLASIAVANNRQMRIYGGSKSPIESAPYTVFFIYRNKAICGGALISMTHVLTAAHCAVDAFPDLNSTAILAGTETTTVSAGVPDDKMASLVQISKIDLHPNYRISKYYLYDLAVVTLKTPLKQSKKIKPIKLTKRGVIMNERVTVTGTGVYDCTNTLSSVLKSYETNVVDCKEYERTLFEFPEPSVFCHFDENRHCKTGPGDSGGPLVNRQGELIGIHTSSFDNSVQTATNLYYLSPFIKSKMVTELK